MPKRLKSIIKVIQTARPHHLMAAFAVMVFACGLIVRGVEKDTIIEPVVDTQYEAVTVTGPILEESNPLTLRIPKIDLAAPFSEPLGLAANREVEVPDDYETVGYYKYGPTPGELGPAVVLGHVDSYEGPAVFFYLGQLEPGDDVYIDRDDGTQAHFVVTSLERHEQSGFPTQKVYGNIDHAGLRLITCSGTYNRDAARYTHNLIVFAQLVKD